MVPSADGTRIAVYPAGHGPGLVVVGGALADHTAVMPLLPLLEQRFTVHAYDRRGRGASGDAPEYAVERELEDLAAVAAYAGPEAAVYGFCSGAILALEAAARGPAPSRLIVYEPPYIVNGRRARPAADLPDRLAALVAAGDEDGAVRTFLREGSRLPETLIQSMDRNALRPLARTTVYDARVAGQCVLPAERFGGIVAPTTVLCGGASPSWLRTGARELATTLRDARFVLLGGQLHAPDPAMLARAIIGA
jgi:pimeloyl-ACP methyl ester carboxylesterase